MKNAFPEMMRNVVTFCASGKRRLISNTLLFFFLFCSMYHFFRSVAVLFYSLWPRFTSIKFSDGYESSSQGYLCRHYLILIFYKCISWGTYIFSWRCLYHTNRLNKYIYESWAISMIFLSIAQYILHFNLKLLTLNFPNDFRVFPGDMF